jgi:hypothetical protein
VDWQLADLTSHGVLHLKPAALLRILAAAAAGGAAAVLRAGALDLPHLQAANNSKL